MAKNTMVHGVDISHKPVDLSDPNAGGGAVVDVTPARAQETGPRNPRGLGRSMVKKAQYAEKAKLKTKLKA